MSWIKSGIENPSKSEVIVRCGEDEKTQMTTQNRQKSNAKKTKKNYLYVQYCLGNNTSTNTDQITITNITREHSFDNVYVN